MSANFFEQLVLKRADMSPADAPTLIPRLEEDAVLYDDLATWPTTADGTSHSLQRISIAGLGDQSSSWTVAVPTPGSVSTTLPGDFNGDSAVDDTDIDLLFAAIVAGRGDMHYDLDGSGSTTIADVTFLVSTLLSTNFGDTDLDQDIDTGDLTRAIINFTGARSTTAADLPPARPRHGSTVGQRPQPPGAALFEQPRSRFRPTLGSITCHPSGIRPTDDNGR